MSRIAIIIPARLGSTRFPRKVLAPINGTPMVVCVAEQAVKSAAGDVFIACCEQEVADVVISYGYKAILTDPALPTGSDRIYQASKQIGNDYSVIVNLQGDVPLIDPKSIKVTIDTLVAKGCDIATIAAPIVNEEEKQNPNVVKAIIALDGRALYFTRSNPYGNGPCYHHIGIYAYKKEALEKFVNLPQSPLEKRESLEQLRALENGMSIAVGIVEDFPHGVDTEEDLQAILKVTHG
jgi:3-deoxy-manno-octulosonate cytidylyltransferase (CMP-KDO synthetase)